MISFFLHSLTGFYFVQSKSLLGLVMRVFLCLNCTSHTWYVIFWSPINPWMSVILSKRFTFHLCSLPPVFILAHPSSLRGNSDPSSARVHLFQLFSQLSFSPSIHKHVLKAHTQVFSRCCPHFLSTIEKVS